MKLVPAGLPHRPMHRDCVMALRASRAVIQAQVLQICVDKLVNQQHLCAACMTACMLTGGLHMCSPGLLASCCMLAAMLQC